MTATLFDYLPADSVVVLFEQAVASATEFWQDLTERFEDRRYNTERPLLSPQELYMSVEQLHDALAHLPCVELSELSGGERERAAEFASRAPISVPISARATEPLALLTRFVEDYEGRVLFVAESAGRRERLLEILNPPRLRPAQVESWAHFLRESVSPAITVGAIEHGLALDEPPVAVLTEAQLFGQRAMQRRRRKTPYRDAESIIKDLTELSIGTPVVHEHHGVGRYQGLETLDVGGSRNEFLAIEYADGDRLYVPVSSLHLVSRYSGTDIEHAPLHKLGASQWQKARKRAAERAYDVAAELLDVQARRASRMGNIFKLDDSEYQSFTQGFPFEETPDQLGAINDVIDNMASEQPMDRLICGDVGFGKTEVAMRATFVAVQDGWQVAILVPTTLLAQQHFNNFRDRFADWPVRIELLSRFRTKAQHAATASALASGQVDIVIGTHKLLQGEVRFKRLGLVIIDEEHRFGVRQKERLKALRAEVDVLTLTATPIPRTLNMAMSGLRDLSLIGTPPERRLSIKTFVRQWDDGLIREACLREIRRGGQVFFVHNRVEDIDKIAQRVEKLVPEASVRVAHGQMREHQLEQVMLDFYHQRFNLLVCTTIIETGIDVPSANTMVINRADRFGLAQLHQLRGRVGRSHHRAYAYLVVPPRTLMTADAIKRLEAIESLEDLGIGFSLATHDLEIRGAGELLGEEQSGQIQEVGYSMYTELLERAVHALKAGKNPALDRPLDHGAEIDLRAPALLPTDYLPDIHMRLIMYKRIANAGSESELEELQVEMIDRFGLLPEAAKTLFHITRLKLKATPLGVRKIELSERGGRIVFGEQPNIDSARLIQLIQENPEVYKLDGKDRLRLRMELPELEDRFRAIETLLHTCSSEGLPA
jgi:transcription-repair coupling factor (superfamily II helicase)